MVGAGGCRWSVSNVVGGRCFAFLLVGDRFLFLRMVGGRCLNQYMVGGRWSVVGGWSVGGGFVLRLFYSISVNLYFFEDDVKKTTSLLIFYCLGPGSDKMIQNFYHLVVKRRTSS